VVDQLGKSNKTSILKLHDLNFHEITGRAKNSDKPKYKTGKSAALATAEYLKQFYVCDEISTIMPKTKDYTSVNFEGKKVHLQKLLILFNLKQAHLSFKKQNPEKLTGFSKFFKVHSYGHKLCDGWSKWNTCSLCVYHSSECETYNFRCKFV
jgi:hypothetical protein